MTLRSTLTIAGVMTVAVPPRPLQRTRAASKAPCAAADVRGSAYVGVRVLGAVKDGQLDDGADESRELLDALAAGDAKLSFGRRLVQADVGCVDERCAYGVER